MSLSKFGAGQDWRLRLAQSRRRDLLLWITRGQGRLLLNGARRGLGAHNALWIPANTLFALDLGRQGMGQVVAIPTGSSLRLPEMARQLRIRNVDVQTELTSLIETAQREIQQDRPLCHDAMEAHAALLSVWLRRQIMQEEHLPEKRNAAARLSARFCDLVAQRYTTGAPLSEYAEELGVTATHLTRAVKAATGKTASDILTERVLFAARSLLEETRQPAHQIARHLGFGSAAYFTRFIQQHAGQPPSRLRGSLGAVSQFA